MNGSISLAFSINNCRDTGYTFGIFRKEEDPESLESILMDKNDDSEDLILVKTGMIELIEWLG